ncbi:MAG: aldehyde ferredoxin oxidoreductase N-terminal domain-containing protein [Dehalococcoidales bacterium]|nr:aldehyde ferredoxin oxidoreductase N-terminal domain-containing protein [Dehalococcoidales bacterium]MDD3264876.1 aldehyde ferredoxin oxidoreductase N-terminal domain-containing protein [Dehalococcoidales bacterium]MDD4322973.1 aldehyde ferredoxin oxidoreductase N-terminal domain-containing protein [Dehalococcoidales bacterium]MDD4794523.1 aldehyde ferredoxin oxidoreductase N-terminal domain-containing protein [Dehalococcoidales bacterium]MDD5122352.1 aldehyde ferredoxin oxidoreductase N-ter
MSEMYGYAGKILKVDLTSGQITEIPSSNYLPKHFGGRSLAAKLYWDEVPPEAGALEPENALIFTSGPLAGTGASMTAVSQCAAKAPILYPSQSYHCCSAAGAWGHEMKYAGYDAFIIKGKASKPVYLWINDGKVEIRDAGRLWGRTGTRGARAELQKIHGDKIQVACIGPAGENQVVFSVINVDCSTAYGQGGFGAVMGSKNLKAIAIRGTGSIKSADPAKLIEVNEASRRLIGMRDGEVRVINGKEVVGTVDIDTTDFLRVPDRAEIVERGLGKARMRRSACPACLKGCKTKWEYADGSLPTGSAECGELQMWHGPEQDYYGGLPFGRVSYQWTMTLDDLGLDSNSVGCNNRGYPVKIETVSHGATSQGLDLWREAHRKGILTEENSGLPWSKFGSKEFMEQWLYMVAHRKGFGDIIASGAGPAVKYIMEHEEFGPNRGEMEYMYQKEYPKAGEFGGIPRHTLFHGYGYGQAAPAGSLYTAVGSRRGRKPITYMIDYPMVYVSSLMPFYGDKAAEKFAEFQTKFYGTTKGGDPAYWGEELAKAVIIHENYANECDSAPRCAFSGNNFGAADMSEHMSYSMYCVEEYLSAVLGEDINQERLFLLDERCINLERAIWVRDGYTNGPVDTFFDVIFEETDSTGNRLIPREGFETALNLYWQQRGWKNGVPTRAKLEELGLEDVADQLQALGKLPI